MTEENFSSPDIQPSDTNVDADSSFPQRIDDFYEALKDHPWVNSRLFRVSWMSKFREQAEAEYEWTVKWALGGFESGNAISMDDKQLIRKTVHNSIAHTKAYDTFAGEGEMRWLAVLVFLLGILILILSGLIWHLGLQNFFEWLGFYVAATFAFVLILFSVDRLLSFVDRLSSLKARKLMSFSLAIVFTYIIPYLLFSWSQRFVWEDSFVWLGNAIMVGSLSGMVSTSIFVVGFVFGVVKYYYQRWVKLKKYPYTTFVAISIDTLIRLGDPDWTKSSLGYFLAKPFRFVQYYERTPLVNDLETMSLSLENLLTRNMNNYDAYTQAWLKQNSIQIANDVRRLKQLIMLPGNDTRQQVVDAIAQKLILVAQGHYGQLERYEMPPLQTRRALLMAWLHKTISLLIPVAMIIAVQLLPFEFDVALKNSITTLGVGWVVVAVLNLIDPTALNQIKEGSNLLGMFKKGS